MYASVFGSVKFPCLSKILNKIHCTQDLNGGTTENTSRGRGDDMLARAVSLSLEVGF